mmetsp:Transcript_9188/g.18793  ORF Transcript_9188/g.18793 Transcript_9188/m.18793 type:complete len:99 (-) Transcript_9188:307-603(-)
MADASYSSETESGDEAPEGAIGTRGERDITELEAEVERARHWERVESARRAAAGTELERRRRGTQGVNFGTGGKVCGADMFPKPKNLILVKEERVSRY